MTGPGSISLVVLTHEASEPLLVQCLDSLERAGAPRQAQVWIGYNGGGSARDAAIARLSRRYPWARWAALERSTRGRARNRVAAMTSGDIIHFLDDDTVAPPDFFERLERAYAAHPQAPAVGGPNVGPPGASAFQRAVDFLLRSPLGAGPMRSRYLRRGRASPRGGLGFMLSNMGARREVMLERGILFPERCASAEENLFLFELERRVGRAVFDPELYVYHRRRDGWSSFCAQVACNGKGRAQITRARPASLHPAVLAPWAAAAAAAALAACGRWEALAAITTIYLAAAATEALRLAVVERDPAAAWRLPALLVCAHLAYGWGLAAGLLESEEPAASTAWPRVHAPADA